jgi:predicted histone-like DNA-binding protein
MYRLVQDNRKASKNKGMWYGRAVISGVMNTKDLAERISNRCTVTYPDILAVISALVTEMGNQLRDSKRVVLDGLGAFKIGIKTVGAESASAFKVSSNVKGMHVLFQPETTIDAATGKHSNELTRGAKVENLADFQDAGIVQAEKERAEKKAAKVGQGSGSNQGAGGSTTPSTGGNTPSTGGDDEKEF